MNTQKLLYILPDLSYVAELLPTKKPNTFSIQTFRQINGEFMDENVFLPESIDKLFSKLEKEEYQLILPDFLFTNTMITVQATDDEAIAAHIKEKTLPDLELTQDSHHIETTVLSQLKDNARVQLTALEKSLLAPIRAACDKYQIKISTISPLTWTIKSVVSLEPSISVIQIGSNLYAALHYIGVDQAVIANISEVDVIAETIKTLKGGEPNIQTIYLLANHLVEQQLGEQLAQTIPVQQLASFKEEESKMPSYVKQIIEAGLRTLSIKDFPVPKFKPGKASTEDKAALASGVVSSDTIDTTDTKEEEIMSDLPKPSQKKASPAASAKDEPKEAQTEKTEKVEEPKTEALETKEEKPVSVEVEEIESAPAKAETQKPESEPEPDSGPEPEQQEVDLSRFASQAQESEPIEIKSMTKTEGAGQEKNKTKGNKTMLRMLFITLAVFFATVAIGIGIGLLILNVTNSNSDAPETPVVITQDQQTDEASAAAQAEPTATPAAELDRAEYDILIVNATTKAGYAGTFKTALEEAKYKSVTAANAKGEYEEGLYVLMPEEDKALVDALAEDTELDLVFAEGYKTEDAAEKYNAVVVLAK